MILLDTHVLVWLANGDPGLGEQARRLIDEAATADAVRISTISFWELGLLIERSRIRLPLPLADFAELVSGEMAIGAVPVNARIAVESGNLPPGLHGDPGDRLIAATARVLPCALLTCDGKLLRYAEAGHLQAIDARL